MTTITLQDALAAINLHNNSNTITAVDIQNLLQIVPVTFANITSVTPVKLAAVNKGIEIQKVGIANVIVSSKLKEFTSIYQNRVKKTASTIAGNDQSKVDDFTPAGNYFFHTDCYSVVQHKTNPTQYLYAMYTGAANSVYVCDGQLISKEDVAALMTPAAASNLLDTKATVTNKTTGIEHAAIIRTTKLSNLVQINACKQQLIK